MNNINNELKLLSEELKNARESNNITLQAIFKRTRIDIKFLKALEEGDFNVIDEIFIKAFLKEYASSVGLKPDEIIAKYELAKQGKLKDFGQSVSENSSEEKPKKSTKVFISPDLESPVQNFGSKKSKQILIFAVGLSFLVIVTLLYLLFLKDRDAIIVQQKPFEEVQEEMMNNDDKSRFDLAAADSSNSESVQSGKLKLQIIANSKVWLRVVMDKQNQDEFFLEKDSSKILNAFHNYSILLGDAGSVKFILNGKPLNFNASRGEIKNISIDSTGLKLLYLKNSESVK